VFELFVGRTPFHDTEAPAAILMRQINDPVPPLTSLVPDVDPAISDWVDRLLVKDPAERTRSAANAWQELEGLLIGRLGARWLDGAALPARPGGSIRASVPMVERGTFAATVAPATLPPEPEPERGHRNRRQLRRPAVLALLVAGLVAGVAAASIGGHAPRPAAPEPSRAAGAGVAVRPAERAARRRLEATAAAYREAHAVPARPSAPRDDRGVGDSRSDDPSDDEPDEEDEAAVDDGD
jgi:hypothetical protein